MELPHLRPQSPHLWPPINICRGRRAGGPGRGGCAPTLLQAALKVGGADVATSHGALHVLLEQPSVVLQDLSSFLVERVFGVGLLWPV